jgi:hypothetical protein
MVWGLVFVPPAKIVDVYRNVVLVFWEAHREDESLRDSQDAIDNLTVYLERTWIGRLNHQVRNFIILLILTVYGKE